MKIYWLAEVLMDQLCIGKWGNFVTLLLIYHYFQNFLKFFFFLMKSRK